MERVALAPKPLASLVRALAASMLAPPPPPPAPAPPALTYDDLAPVLSTATIDGAAAGGAPAATAVLAAFVTALQRHIAAAAVHGLTASDFSALVASSNLPACGRDALEAWWREAREEVVAALAARPVGAGVPAFRRLAWRVDTHTAASTDGEGSGSGGGEGGKEPVAMLEFATDDGALLAVSASKAVVGDLLAAVASLRREVERAAAST